MKKLLSRVFLFGKNVWQLIIENLIVVNFEYKFYRIPNNDDVFFFLNKMKLKISFKKWFLACSKWKKQGKCKVAHIVWKKEKNPNVVIIFVDAINIGVFSAITHHILILLSSVVFTWVLNIIYYIFNDIEFLFVNMILWFNNNIGK